MASKLDKSGNQVNTLINHLPMDLNVTDKILVCGFFNLSL